MVTQSPFSLLTLSQYSFWLCLIHLLVKRRMSRSQVNIDGGAGPINAHIFLVITVTGDYILSGYNYMM